MVNTVFKLVSVFSVYVNMMIHEMNMELTIFNYVIRKDHRRLFPNSKVSRLCFLYLFIHHIKKNNAEYPLDANIAIVSDMLSGQ